ncbi:MAG: hypothetical protein U5K72_17190 [Balneolaceae bacterium]|nr:hypothetical protein [Balneolaceae bacterium]
MDALIIKSENKKDLALLKKMGLESKTLTAEEMEDIGMSILLDEADRTKTVPEKEIMEILDS